MRLPNLTTAARLARTLAVVALMPALPALAFEQAPMLKAKVEAGTLPPVDERLPKVPYVYQVVDRIGDYGGTWRRVIRGGGDQHNFVRVIGYNNLVRWDRDWKEVQPHIAQSVETNAESTVFTFHLREGMRWSDGQPFTADDIMFWYEDVLLNKDLTKGIDPLWASPTGTPVKVAKVDDETVTFTFDAPYATFLDRIAYGFGAPPTLYPKHYLKQFHIKYNPDGIPALIKAQQGIEDWVGLFNSKVAPTWTVGYWQNPDLPTLNPWVLTNAYGQATRIIAERNPYYFGVDPEGNQLPYIDRIVYDQVEDDEVVLLKALNGEIDYQLRHINNPENKAVILQNREKGDYRLFEVQDSSANQPTIYFNLTSTDPVKREIFNNKDFRIALSQAIDRDQIIDVVYLGQGAASQAAPRPESPFYVERLAKQYLDYDPDQANAILDKAGFDKRDGDGWRLGPDGKPIAFVIMATPGDGRTETMDIVVKEWQDIGINAQYRQVDRSLMTTSLIGNDYDGYIWDSPGGLGDSITDPRGFLPFNTTVIFIAPLWAEWNMNPANGQEPPPDVKKQLELYNSIDSLADPQARIDRMKEVLNMAADQFYSIGIRQPPNGFGIARNQFKNILDPQPYAGPLWRPAPDTAQFFIEAGSQ